jgi:hypothetical protein
VRKPTAIERLALVLALIAAGAVAVWLLTDAADEWMPNLGVDAASLVLVVLVVERLTKREAQTRMRLRIDPLFRDIGLELRFFLGTVAYDYAETHLDTFEPIPTDGIELLDQWLLGQSSEDAPRPKIEGFEFPALIEQGLQYQRQTREWLQLDRDVLDPEFVRASDEFRWKCNQAANFYALHASLHDGEESPAAVARVVEGARDFAEVFKRHGDPGWLGVLDLTINAANEIHERAVRQREAAGTTD